ncbi:MAG: DUF116 domain-containing protein [Verrucomicrobia bacterium]|nr:DUF116 domain-containing protein [Verrucomicrobiota bacterium]
MADLAIIIPRHVAQHRTRETADGIPPVAATRFRLRNIAREYVAEFKLVAPLPAEELTRHATNVLARAGGEEAWRDFVAVLLNNEMWRDTVAAVPYNRRLLLLPKCLRNEADCKGYFDEFGLVCQQCGACAIRDLQEEAEKLGYAVMVAEGSQIVTSLLQAGRIDAILGVSCLNVLRKAYPYMEAGAIPGLAIPLLQDDCQNTTVDMDWVWEYITLSSDDQTHRLDLGALRHEVESWFTRESIETLVGPAEGETEVIARDWLAKGGKRWRPFLTVAVFQALRDDPEAPIPPEVCRAALAIECFHKASLIHDDIEDNDSERYGERTLHAAYGVPVALNIGDLLIGEGYRLLATSQFDEAQKARMLRIAAEGQRQLCQGQGSELNWDCVPRPLSSLEVLEIFQKKTAPAFEVALKLGALCACAHNEALRGQASYQVPHPVAPGKTNPEKDTQPGCYEKLAPVLKQFSAALGVAYQIRDDLADWAAHFNGNGLAKLRPSLVLAIAHERARGDAKRLLDGLWRRQSDVDVSPTQLMALCADLEAGNRAQTLLDTFREEAIRALSGLDNTSLKGLLRRAIGKIFNELEIKGWCKEFQAARVAAQNTQAPT